MSSKKRRAPGVNDLRPFEQAAVLTTLARRRDAVGEAVREEIERLLAGVDPEAIASEVQFDLEHIDVDAIADRSGSDRYGYTAPHEAAWQMLEETLEPHLERLRWYHDAGRDEACDAYALGVLRGIYDFDHDSDAEWKAWSPDDAREAFGWVLGAWQKHRKGSAVRQAMRDQLANWCPGWERDAS
ncbi:MAG: hypothetical protein EA416_12965 [Trueperaceae bacterium]|nr:MAG: hypothetical protein EA416_12965 [Trueperaceae bacterium]